MIYEDANRLEAVLKNKIKELGPEPGKKKKWVEFTIYETDNLLSVRI